MSKKVLVTGATGKIAEIAIPQLVEKGISVRAFVRNPEKAKHFQKMGVEIAVGEFLNEASMDAAMVGMDAVLSISEAGADGDKYGVAITKAAKKAGVKQLVRVSVIGSAADGPTENVRMHATTDSDIIASGLNYTILRPNFFMQNVFMSVGSIAAEGNMYWGMGDGKIGMVDVRDIADCAVAVLVNGGHDNKIYTLSGLTSVSFSDIAEIISEGIGKKVNYIAVPPAAVKESIVGMGMTEWFGQVMMDYSIAYSRGWGDVINDDTKTITGKPARSFQQFFDEVMTWAFKQTASV